MGIKKKLMAVVLTAALVMSFAVPALAVTSSPKNPGYNEKTDYDVNTQDHKKNTTVTTKVYSDRAVTKSVTAGAGRTEVTIDVARDKDNNKRAITRIGFVSENTGVFNSTNGRKITLVKIKSSADTVVVSNGSFRNSNVRHVAVTSKKISIAANAFNGTKVKDLSITIHPNKDGEKKTAASVSVQTGAFNGLNKSSKFYVKKSAMSLTEFKKLVRKLQEAGFPGTAVYVS